MNNEPYYDENYEFFKESLNDKNITIKDFMDLYREYRDLDSDIKLYLLQKEEKEQL